MRTQTQPWCNSRYKIAPDCSSWFASWFSNSSTCSLQMFILRSVNRQYANSVCSIKTCTELRKLCGRWRRCLPLFTLWCTIGLFVHAVSHAGVGLVFHRVCHIGTTGHFWGNLLTSLSKWNVYPWLHHFLELIFNHQGFYLPALTHSFDFALKHAKNLWELEIHNNKNNNVTQEQEVY